MENQMEDLHQMSVALTELASCVAQVPSVSMADFKQEHTALVIMDMVYGFVRQGALYSSRVEKLVPTITALCAACSRKKIAQIAFADCHSPASPEFASYPMHCLDGTRESKVIDEIKACGSYTLIPKNSTNGFLEEAFRHWLETHDEIDTFLIVGDCTDICVQQFAITLKTEFNRCNRKSRVIVPQNAVATYDLGPHNGDLMQLMALYTMMGSGVEVVKEVTLEK